MKRPLSTTAATKITAPGRYRADVGLYLKVTDTGGKSWIQRVVINGKRRDLGLGPFPVVTLDEAKAVALENRRLLRAGGDPLAEKRKARTPTFQEATEKTFEANRARWRSEVTARNWEQGMKKHVLPIIGDTPVDQITRENVLRILTPIWTSKPEIARKQRNRIRTVLSWCQAHGYIEHNVAGEMIDGALPAMPAVKEHFRALDYREVPAALETVEESTSGLAAKLCFRFLVLTACRSGEVRSATWSEIDMEAREWRIPASRMKNSIEHRVPLSDAALAVLERARILYDGSGLVFPSSARQGRPLSDMTMTKILRTTGLADKTTGHGFRSSFRDWASERTNTDHAVMELCLAHTVGNSVERAYARSDLLAKRRLLMDQWAAYATGASSANVVELRR